MWNIAPVQFVYEKNTNLASHTHNYAASSSPGGSATSAVKLSNARTLQTNLANTSAVGFDGTANKTIGVTGTLPIGNGGTGATSIAGILNNIFKKSGQYTYIATFGSLYTEPGYITPAQLKTFMSLNNVNNTADSAKTVKLANGLVAQKTTLSTMDSITVSGIYYGTDIGNGGTTPGIFLHLQYDTNYAVQIGHDYGAQHLWYRAKANAKWGTYHAISYT